MSVTDFLKVKDEDLPKELFNLDILDGSPPCSSFSLAGNREKNWGDKKKFREGQTEQILDDLFFYFIKIAQKLKPKVVIAENVKGLIQGLAKGYVKEIFAAFKAAGYEVQLFLLNSAKMGVPQYRERTFFIANNIGKKISLSFNEREISLEEAFKGCKKNGRELFNEYKTLWANSKEGDSFSKAHHKGNFFNTFKVSRAKPSNTITASSGAKFCHYDSPRELSDEEIAVIQTFPMDYNFLNNKPKYVCGMSVPPFMMNRLSIEVIKQFELVKS